jgi:hypothetical protein
MRHADRLLRILARLDRHFRANDSSTSDADRWRELKNHITRMRDGLDLARVELESPHPDVTTALRHVRFGLEDPMKPLKKAKP